MEEGERRGIEGGRENKEEREEEEEGQESHTLLSVFLFGPTRAGRGKTCRVEDSDSSSFPPQGQVAPPTLTRASSVCCHPRQFTWGEGRGEGREGREGRGGERGEDGE